MNPNIDSSHIINKLGFQVAILISIVNDSERGKSFNSQRHNWHYDLTLVEEYVGQWSSSFENDIHVFERLGDLCRFDKKRQLMMVFANLVRIETNFNFQFLFGFDNTLGLRDFKDTIVLNFRVIKFPSDFVFIKVLNHDAHKLGIASVRLGDNFSFKVNDWWLKDKLGLDGLT
jgi:hypothetical protein